MSQWPADDTFANECDQLFYFLSEKGDMTRYTKYLAALAMIQTKRPELFALIQAYQQQEVVLKALRERLEQELRGNS